MKHSVEEEWVVRCLKLLEDHFLLSIMAELVGVEEVTIIESCEVVDVNKPCLGKDKERAFRLTN